MTLTTVGIASINNWPPYKMRPSERLQQVSNILSDTTQSISTEKRNPNIMTVSDYKFFGWVAKDKNSIGNLVWQEYEPKKWTEDDVDIKISTSHLID